MNRAPLGWKEVKLGDVCSRVNDMWPDRSKWHFDRYIGGDDFDSGEVRITRSKPIKGNEEVMGYQFQWRFQPGDVLYVVKNPRLRKAGIVNFEGICSISSFVLRTDTSKLIQELLPFLLQTEDFVFHACNNAHGSTNPFLNWKDIAKYTFFLPPIEEQKKISSILWTIEKHVEKTESLIQVAEKFKEGLLEELLTRGIGHKKFKKTELGEIPDEWSISTIGDICTVRRGASPRPIGDKKYFSEEGPGWIRISDITPIYKYVKKTEQYLSEAGASCSVPVSKGDLVMSICATIGKPVIIDMTACIHDGFVLFQDIKNLTTEYLFYLLLRNEAYFKMQKQEGTQGNLNTSIVENTLIAIPKDKDEQKRVISLLNQVDSLIENMYNALRKSKSLQKKILNDLLSGVLETKRS